MDTDNTPAAASTALSKPKPDGVRPVADGSPRPTATPRMDVNVIPDEVEVALTPPPLEMVPESLRPMWHRVVAKPGALVSLRSEHDKLQVVCLSAVSKMEGWNPRWVQWTYAVRQVPKDLGGDALAAQDILTPDKSELTLLVLPGEQRSVTLEFDAWLNGENQTGDYPFDVVATDVESGETFTAPGLLRLRHQETRLLKLLPSIYSQQPTRIDRFAPFEEKPFFERFLRGFEDALEPTNTLLARMAEYFDADGAPPDFLPWLGTWVSLVLDENWPELKRRRLIKEAVELYRWRGTRRGLLRYLEIYTGIVPEINDHPFQGMRLGPQTLLGIETLLGDVPKHTFVVTIAIPDPKTINEQTVRDIIESQKPAHTAYALRIVERSAE
jgi:phage tail-like protein